ncbi:mechanosensitive ion channel family protein [Mongoliitalea daihaiensis]|uniref:mechanosensitive ion channel family protein n=1 Tax=Mongoliitalea daihaiensis TaxID=2782006 RepID=UPI001F177818|nr:mechanosensitive ion channel family protein [Mongoliitalea daihaiensis]UJP65475.1 mechanosensitive ion channel family protein [Mongoliitalea daihaiensis]
MKRFSWIWVIICLSWNVVSAQVMIDGSPVPIDPEDYHNLQSPYTASLTFFLNLREDNFDPEAAAMALMTEELAGDVDFSELAFKLKQIFDGNGVVVKFSEIPSEASYIDTVFTNQAKYFFDSKVLPLVYLQRYENEWKFSAFTVSQIDELHQATFPFGTDKLMNQLPKIGTNTYFGFQTWQLVGLFGFILLLFLAHKLFTFIFDRVILYTLNRMGYGNLGERYILPVAKVLSIYLILLVSALVIRLLQLPVEVVSFVLKILHAAKPFVLTIVFYKIVDIIALYFAKLAEKTESTLDDQLVPLIRKTLKSFVVVVGTLFILKEGLDVDIVPFLTGLSIGGLAFALAAQDTIKNFFGSVMIFIDKPFQVGDWITSGDVDGTVEEVGFRSTRIRTFRNSVTYIPNGKIADATIDNHGLRKYRRFYTTLTITYDTPHELVETFVEGLREIVLNHPDTRKDAFNIYFNNLSSYSKDIMFYIFFEVPTWPEELRCRHEILIQIVQLSEVLGVRFAFPTQTLHMESFPEKKDLVPVYPTDSMVYKQKLSQFFNQELGKKE